jgi:hypothetical protein
LPRVERPVDGDLALDFNQVGSELLPRARLLTGTGALLLPEMLYARVRKITHNGIVITAYEFIARSSHSKSNVERYPQCWWVLVHTLSAMQSAGLGEYYEDEVLEPASWLRVGPTANR